LDNIIITGGLGFIGSRFAKLCIEKGHNVKIIDKMTYAADPKRLHDTVPNWIEFPFNKLDICDVTVNDINGYQYVVNFAAETHVDNSISDGRPFIRSNVEGVFNLLEQCRRMSQFRDDFKKFIQISTDEVYGDVLAGESKEGDKLNPSSYYSATKASADMLVKSACRTYGLPYIITRTCNNYGPGQHEEKFIPKLEKCLQENKPIPVYTPGTQIREWIHVDDNCKAIYNLMVSNKINDIYNIGSGERYNNLEVIDILDKDNKANIELVTDRKGHDKRYALNSNKYKSEFGDPSSITFKEYYK
jgi:dTDP-glucose 4,6-dehydratase